MTPSTESAKPEQQTGAPAASSPKPKPAGSPKPKPNVTGSPSGKIPGGGPRLAPFETYRRTDTASGGGSTAASAEGRMMTKPVAKRRLIAVFPGGGTKS